MRPERPSDPAPRFVEVRGGPVAYIDEGPSGPLPPVVALHGLPGSSRDFRWLAPAVAERQRIVRPDLPGFGDTPARTSPGFDVASRSALVGELLDALELPPVVVIGHSMGGVVAAHLALARPDRVQRLVLAASPGLVLHRGMRHLPFGALTRLLATERRARVLRPVSKRVFDYFGFRGRYPPDAYRRTVLQAAGVDIAAHAARLRRLTLPTAVVWCEDDPLVEPVIGDGIAAAVPPGPRLRFADGGHNPQKHHAIEIAACLAADWHESGKRGTSDPA